MTLSRSVWFERLFGDKVRHKVERATIIAAIVGFVIHLILYLLGYFGVAVPVEHHNLLADPVQAIYTPFSVILLFEVYLFVYYLPRSFTSSLGKQFEIAVLILIRKIFQDITELDLGEAWWHSRANLSLLSDMAGVLLMFFLIFVFYRLTRRYQPSEPSAKTRQFIRIKKAVSIILIPILVGLSLYSFTDWIIELIAYQQGDLPSLKDVNQVFYREFFTLLIVVDVLLLIVSLLYTEDYHRLIRNAGYVISTILIRLSFSAPAFFQTLLSLLAIGFSVLILFIFLRFESLGEAAPTED